MSNVLAFYQQQAQIARSNIPWLAALQVSALSDLQHMGFPDKQDEEWKYISLTDFLMQRFEQRKMETIEPTVLPMHVPFAQKIMIVNGRVVNNNAYADQLPSGVIVQPLLTALTEHAQLIQPYLTRILPHQHGFHALNMAALQTGIFIYVPKNKCVEFPIVLAHWQDQTNQAVHVRHVIVAEEGCSLNVVEVFQGGDGCSYLTNTVTEAYVAPHAVVAHYKMQCESKAAHHIGHLAVQQMFASQFDSHLLSIGAKLARSDITMQLCQAQARCLLNGIYMPTDNQYTDHHTAVHHLVPECSSVQDYKGIIGGTAHAVFNGKVVVAPGAQQSCAHQHNKNLLLSEGAEINTKPQLDIFADDVVCAHGATVGQLDEEALFYMSTRGLTHYEASCYLLHAFAADNVRLVPHIALAEWIVTLMNQQLGWKDE